MRAEAMRHTVIILLWDIRQGGNANTWSGTRVAYPIAFNSAFSTVITKNANADSEYGFYDVNKDSFKFKINTNGSWNIYWLAVGY